VQRWPVDANAPKTVDSTASGRSASERITSGFLPPFALAFLHAARALCVKLAADFVRTGERNRAHIRMLQQFVADLTARSHNHVEYARWDAGLLEDLHDSGTGEGGESRGLEDDRIPEISAGAIFQTGMETGKFHGAIAATTPSGCFSVYAKFFGSSLGIVSPPSRRPSPAMNSRILIDFCTSPSASSALAFFPRHQPRNFVFLLLHQ